VHFLGLSFARDAVSFLSPLLFSIVSFILNDFITIYSLNLFSLCILISPFIVNDFVKIHSFKGNIGVEELEDPLIALGLA